MVRGARNSSDLITYAGKAEVPLLSRAKWIPVVPDATALVVSTTPAVGTVTEASEASVWVNLIRAGYAAGT